MSVLEVTVCLTNWRRPEYLRRLIRQLREQSVKATIFLWNNGEAFSCDDAIDWTVTSSLNQICWPRWFMASMASTEFCFVIDDDLELLDSQILKIVAERLMQAPESTIVGLEGVNLIKGASYLKSDHIRLGREGDGEIPCDIVKGTFMGFRTAAIRKRVPLMSFADSREDDIAISAYLAGGEPRGHICLRQIWPGVRLHDAPHSLWRKAGHFERRDAAARRFFNIY
ncbi:MAG: hypothetical protein ABI672_18450 [Vicinamibacteria bacterium]